MDAETTQRLLTAIRKGEADKVREALDAGASPHDDGNGHPGLPLAMAVLFGTPAIVRELVNRGAAVNPPTETPSERCPLKIAVKRKNTEVVRTLLELGATIPPGLDLQAAGLSSADVVMAQRVAKQLGLSGDRDAIQNAAFVESILYEGGCYGVDTNVLEGIKH